MSGEEDNDFDGYDDDVDFSEPDEEEQPRKGHTSNSQPKRKISTYQSKERETKLKIIDYSELQAQTLKYSNDIDELLGLYSETTIANEISLAEQFLFFLKDAIEGIPQQDVTASSVSLPGLHLSSYGSRNAITLSFSPPKRIDVIGSHMIHSSISSTKNIDISVCMPFSCFDSNDVSNFLYFDKRKLYLGVIATELFKSNTKNAKYREIIDTLEFCYHKSDDRKPILQMSISSFGPSQVMIRIFPSLSPSTDNPINFHDLLPNICNVKSVLVPVCTKMANKFISCICQSNDSSIDECNRLKTKVTSYSKSVCHPTCHYNQAILEDWFFCLHLMEVHELCSIIPALTNALILCKIWMLKQDLYHQADSIDGFTITMIVLIVIKSGRLLGRKTAPEIDLLSSDAYYRESVKNLTPLQIFSLVLRFLSEGSLSNTLSQVSFPIRPDIDVHSGNSSGNFEERKLAHCNLLEEYRKYFDVCLLDSSGIYNITWRMSASAAMEVFKCAKYCVSVFQSRRKDAISAVFAERPSFLYRFDAFVRIPLASSSTLLDGLTGKNSSLLNALRVVLNDPDELIVLDDDSCILSELDDLQVPPVRNPNTSQEVETAKEKAAMFICRLLLRLLVRVKGNIEASSHKLEHMRLAIIRQMIYECDMCTWDWMGRFATKLLARGLGDRVCFIRPQTNSSCDSNQRNLSWRINSPCPLSCFSELIVGLNLASSENVMRMVNRGPPPANLGVRHDPLDLTESMPASLCSRYKKKDVFKTKVPFGKSGIQVSPLTRQVCYLSAGTSLSFEEEEEFKWIETVSLAVASTSWKNLDAGMNYCSRFDMELDLESSLHFLSPALFTTTLPRLPLSKLIGDQASEEDDNEDEEEVVMDTKSITPAWQDSLSQLIYDLNTFGNGLHTRLSIPNVSSNSFRMFWGSKSEMRRFKDGSVVEATVWGKSGVDRISCVEDIAATLLEMHDPIHCAKYEVGIEDIIQSVTSSPFASDMSIFLSSVTNHLGIKAKVSGSAKSLPSANEEKDCQSKMLPINADFKFTMKRLLEEFKISSVRPVDQVKTANNIYFPQCIAASLQLISHQTATNQVSVICDEFHGFIPNPFSIALNIHRQSVSGEGDDFLAPQFEDAMKKAAIQQSDSSHSTWRRNFRNAYSDASGVLRLVQSMNGTSVDRVSFHDCVFSANAALDRLRELMKGLRDSPLTVRDLIPVDEQLRSTSKFPPLPNPACLPIRGDINQRKAMDIIGSGCKLSLSWGPLDILMLYERSSKWPDSYAALCNTKTAFMIHTAKCLQTHCGVDSKVHEEYLDVYFEGYCFRLRIFTEHELGQLAYLSQSQSDNINDVEVLKPDDARQLYLQAYMQTEIRPKHHKIISLIATTNPSYSSVVRLVNQWLDSNLFSGMITTEAVELIVAHVFTRDNSANFDSDDDNENQALYGPRSILSGFLRCLKLFADFDWRNKSLIVNFDQKLSHTDSESIDALLTGFRTDSKRDFILESVVRGSLKDDENSNANNKHKWLVTSRRKFHSQIPAQLFRCLKLPVFATSATSANDNDDDADVECDTEFDPHLSFKTSLLKGTNPSSRSLRALFTIECGLPGTSDHSFASNLANPPMMLIAKYMRRAGWFPVWTGSSPSFTELQLICTTANKCVRNIEEWIVSGKRDRIGELEHLYQSLFTNADGVGFRANAKISILTQVLPQVDNIATSEHQYPNCGELLFLRHIHGSSVAQLHLYKNMPNKRLSPSALMMPQLSNIQLQIGSTLRKKFGKYGIFMLDASNINGTVFAVWNPAVFLSRKFQVGQTKHTSIIQEDSGACFMVRNVGELLIDIVSAGCGGISNCQLLE